MHRVQPYAYLQGIQVDRVVSNVSAYLRKAEAYLSTLILVKSIKMVADNMPIKFSNDEWLEIIKEKTSTRGLQHAFTRLENTTLPGFNQPIFQRTFSDDQKRNRTEFKVDTKQLIYLLKLKESDVADMPRGTLERHFFYQSGLKVRAFLKDLKKAEKLARQENFKSDPKLQAEFNRIIAAVKERQEAFDKHVNRIFNRVEKAINNLNFIVTPSDKDAAREALLGLLSDNGYKPPEQIKN